MSSPILKRIISIVVAVLLFIYVGYQIYSANYSSVTSEVATYASASDVIQTTGLVIRKETLVENTNSGVVSFLLNNGDRVAKNGIIANLYQSSEAVTTQQQLESVQNEIEKLQKVSNPGDLYAANPDLLDQQINEQLTSIFRSIQSGDYEDVSTGREELLYRLNQLDIVTGETETFDARIAELQAEKESLTASLSEKTGSITSPVAGYFTNITDGYETVYNYDNALSYTVNDIKTMQSQQPVANANVVGKVCENFDWYVACILPADDAAKLKVGDDSISINLPFAASGDLPAEVAAVNQANKDSEAAVILKCNFMNESLSYVRNETMQISVQTYSGIRINQKAVHFEEVTKTVTDEDGKETQVTKQVRGVYVLHGSELKFVQIFPLFTSGGYIICDSNPEEEELMTDETVRLYDEVVIEGTDLYDGKIV